MIKLSNDNTIKLIGFINAFISHYSVFVEKAESLFEISNQLQDKTSKEFTAELDKNIKIAQNSKRQLLNIQEEICDQIIEDEENSELMTNLSMAKDLIKENEIL